jgi:hypothetical protein
MITFDCKNCSSAFLICHVLNYILDARESLTGFFQTSVMEAMCGSERCQTGPVCLHLPVKTVLVHFIFVKFYRKLHIRRKVSGSSKPKKKN